MPCGIYFGECDWIMIIQKQTAFLMLFVHFEVLSRSPFFILIID